MELPIEIWRKILLETTTKISCKNLFDSFPNLIKKYVEMDYHNHYYYLQTTIGIVYFGKVFIFVNNQKINVFSNKSCIFTIIKFRPNSQEIAIGSDEGHIYLYNYISKKLVNTFILTRKYAIRTMTFSPCGKYLAIAMINNYFILNIEKDSKITTNNVHIERTFYLHYNPYIEFHPTKPIILFHSIWNPQTENRFTSNETQFRTYIINFNDKKQIYFSNQKKHMPKFNKNGNKIEYIKCIEHNNKKKYEIYECDINNNEQQILKICDNSTDHLFDFVRFQDIIYYVIFEQVSLKTYLYRYDFTRRVREQIYEGNIFNIKVSFDGKKIFFQNGISMIVIIDFETNEKLTISSNELLQENDSFPYFESIDLKNF